MTTAISGEWPLNELGEIVVQQGVGTTNVVGYVPAQQITADKATNKVVMVGVGLSGRRQIKPLRTGLKALGIEEFNATTAPASGFGYVAVTTPYLFFAVTMSVESHFDQVAVIFANKSTANSLVIGSAAVQPHQTPSNGTIFTDSGVTRTQLKFSGANSATIAASSRAINTALGFNEVPTYLVSDFANISSLARTENAAYKPCISIGVTIAPTAAGNEISGTHGISSLIDPSTATPTTPDQFGNWFHGARTATATDITMSINSGTAGSVSPGEYCPIVGLIYRSRTGRVLSVLGIGDSITMGINDSLKQGFFRRGINAANIAAAGGVVGNLSAQLMSPTPIDGMNWGVSGMQTIKFSSMYDEAVLQNFTQYINTVIHPPFSPNGGFYKADFAAVMDKYDRANVYPLVWSGLPSYNQVATANAARVELNTIAKSADAGYMEFDTLVTDSGTPGNQYSQPNLQHQYAENGTSYTSGQIDTTSLHPNNAGHAILGTSGFAPKLKEIAAVYFGGKTS